MKMLKRCFEHGYTLRVTCEKCGKETKDAHYKFVKNLTVLERAQDLRNKS